jgi:anti-sigma factor RsiW
MTHERWEGLVIASTVDGTLDADDARELLPHVAECDDCRDLMRDLTASASELALLEPPVSPSPDLEQRILGAVRSNTVQRIARPSRARRMVSALAAAAVLALGTTSVVLYQNLESDQNIDGQLAAALQVIQDPSATIARLSDTDGSATGIVAVAADGSGVLVVDGLPAAPSGKIHELWFIEKGKPLRIEVFSTQGEQTIVPLRVKEAIRFDAAAITIEDAPLGSLVPTGNMLLTGKPI